MGTPAGTYEKVPEEDMPLTQEELDKTRDTKTARTVSTKELTDESSEEVKKEFVVKES